MKHTYFSIALILSGLVLLTSLACTINMGDADTISEAPRPTRTLSEQAIIIMTVQAAPARQLPASAVIAEPTANLVADASAAFDPVLVTEGQTQFTAACSACHGADALGLPNLGKDLVNSEFVLSQTDTDLLNFIKTGRPIWDPLNTTGIDMPPKGGNPALNDDNLLAIITYLRNLSGVSGSTEVSTANTDASVAESNASAYASELISEGQAQFTAACSACHGADALGLPNLGKDLINSEFVDSLSDTDLLTFIKTGRPIWDSLNTTGIDMPPKGGNPTLTDEQILAIIAFVKSQ